MKTIIALIILSAASAFGQPAFFHTVTQTNVSSQIAPVYLTPAQLDATISSLSALGVSSDQAINSTNLEAFVIRRRQITVSAVRDFRPYFTNSIGVIHTNFVPVKRDIFEIRVMTR